MKDVLNDNVAEGFLSGPSKWPEPRRAFFLRHSGYARL